MNKSYKNIIVGLFVCLSLMACNKKSEENKAEEHHDETDVVELSSTQAKAINILLGSFEQKNLSEVITANGYTKLPPQNQAEVSVFMGGIIRSIAVIEGQFVKKGQVLATYQSLDFNNLRLQKTQLLDELQQAKINREYLELDFARQKVLNDENVTARKAFQKISSELELIKSKIKITESKLQIIQQNLAMGGSENNSVQSILSPIAGYITDVNIKIGSNISPNVSLFTIVDNSKMHVDLLVYEKDLFKIKVGQSVRFILTNQSNQEIMGRIFSIGKAFQNESKSVAVHADINNQTANFISGMYVNALIDIGKNMVNTLPIEAVAKAEGKEFIFIQFADNHVNKNHQKEENEGHEESLHFKRIEVKTGTTQLGFVQVTPLQEIPTNTKIVIKGAYYLQSSISNAEGGDDHGH